MPGPPPCGASAAVPRRARAAPRATGSVPRCGRELARLRARPAGARPAGGGSVVGHRPTRTRRSRRRARVALGLAEQRRDAGRDGVGVAEQLEAVHAQVVPAEPAQHVGAQPQRLAQAEAGEHVIGLDDDRLAAVRRHEPELAAVADAHADAATSSRARGRTSIGSRCRRSVGLGARAPRSRRGRSASASTPCLGGRRRCPRGGTQETRSRSSGARASWRPRAAGRRRARRALRSRQQPTVRGAAVADREDDAVAALRDRLLER